MSKTQRVLSPFRIKVPTFGGSLLKQHCAVLHDCVHWQVQIFGWLQNDVGHHEQVDSALGDVLKLESEIGQPKFGGNENDDHLEVLFQKACCQLRGAGLYAFHQHHKT